MKRIIVTVKDKAKAKQILEAVRLFKGVTSASMATYGEQENIAMLKACKDARKTSKLSKEELLNKL